MRVSYGLAATMTLADYTTLTHIMHVPQPLCGTTSSVDLILWIFIFHQNFWKDLGEMGLLGITAPGMNYEKMCWSVISHITLLHECTCCASFQWSTEARVWGTWITSSWWRKCHGCPQPLPSVMAPTPTCVSIRWCAMATKIRRRSICLRSASNISCMHLSADKCCTH